MILARPILRIDNGGNFVTSIGLILDSMTFFIENCLFNYNKEQDIELPNIVFKNAISEPFENKCIDYFRSKGYLAGHVTEKQTWRTQNGDYNLKINKDFPGKIDVLAYHPNYSSFILIECKVLHDIKNIEKYKNLYAKLIDDSEGFRKKLIEKRNWVKEAFMFHTDVNQIPEMIILCDIPLPMIPFEKIDDVWYYHFEELKDTINRQVK